MTEKDTHKPDFSDALAQKAAVVNATLAELLQKQTEIYPALKTAIEYTLNTPGKRIRAALLLWCCELIAGRINHPAKIAAAAIEMVHTYSLVHDDLPAMDDDDLRRGKPSCHKAFGEATAILTGDALLTLAFETIAAEINNPRLAVRLIRILAQAAGPAGMIAGQMADLEHQKAEHSFETLRYIQINKTAEMFAAAAAMGAVAGDANDEQLDHLLHFGLNIGLTFQVADDILDVSATTTQLGKTAGKDEKNGKITYPAVAGIDESKKIAKKFTDQAIETLHIFDEKAKMLRQLAVEMLDRTK